jgi:hypothetical protein
VAAERSGTGPPDWATQPLPEVITVARPIEQGVARWLTVAGGASGDDPCPDARP